MGWKFLSWYEENSVTFMDLQAAEWPERAVLKQSRLPQRCSPAEGRRKEVSR